MTAGVPCSIFAAPRLPQTRSGTGLLLELEADPVRRPSFGSGSLDGSLVNRLPADLSETLRACLRTPESGRLRQHVRPLGYDESVARDIVRQWSEEEFFADAQPPTDDDVPIALDGRVSTLPRR